MSVPVCLLPSLGKANSIFLYWVRGSEDQGEARVAGAVLLLAGGCGPPLSG